MKIGLGIGIQKSRLTSSGASFVPSDISGLVLWLEADSGVTDSGGVVSAWADQSSVENNMTSVNGDPTIVTNALNSLPVIDFDGNDDISSATTAVEGSSNRTVFLVAASDFNNSGDFFLYTGSVSTTGGLFAISGEVAVRANGGAIVFASAALTTSYSINTITFDGASTSDITLHQNGALVSSSSLTAVNINTNSGFTGIGGAGGTAYQNGRVYACIVYNRALSASEREQVESYLSTKTGITLS